MMGASPEAELDVSGTDVRTGLGAWSPPSYVLSNPVCREPGPEYLEYLHRIRNEPSFQARLEPGSPARRPPAFDAWPASPVVNTMAENKQQTKQVKPHCTGCKTTKSLFWYRHAYGCDENGNNGYPFYLCDVCQLKLMEVLGAIPAPRTPSLDFGKEVSV